MSEQACETPLVELLERVPEDARAWYEHGPIEHSHIPYGLHCRRAAEQIRTLTSKLGAARRELQAAFDRNYDYVQAAEAALTILNGHTGNGGENG